MPPDHRDANRLTPEMIKRVVDLTLHEEAVERHPLERAHHGGSGRDRAVVGAQDWRAHGLKPHLVKIIQAVA
jgi:hypothetical protein